MSKGFLGWLFQSLSRKIGGLSSVLLGFLFIVIVYSFVKLQIIGAEMREVAHIDIPLTEVISELEVLQLEKHIVLEKIRFKKQQKVTSDLKVSTTPERQKFSAISEQVKEQLTQARLIIEKGVASGNIKNRVAEHQRVLAVLSEFLLETTKLQLTADRAFKEMHLADGSRHWQQLEKELSTLDKMAINVLQEIEQLTKEIAENTERHEVEFFYVNTALGISALVIGIYLTLHIISSFRRRVVELQDNIETLSQALTSGRPGKEPVKLDVKTDEFSDLAKSMNAMSERFSNELDNRYEIEHQLLHLATTDKLTGAFNRHKWDERLEAESLLAKRGSLLSMILFDLDHFKSINDTYGHDVGDKVLANAVQSIKQVLRESDQVFRLGGEEFAVLMRNQQLPDVANMAEKMRAALSSIHVEGLPIITASFGISNFTSKDSIESFVKRADQAVYQAKNSGRNQVVQG